MIKGQGIAGFRVLLLVVLAAAGLLLCGACRRSEERLEPRSLTWAELRTVRNAVLVTPPGEGERGTYPKERLADGARVRVEAGGLAWLRRDGGATFLVQGPARLTLRARSLSLDEGRVFVDMPPGSSSELSTPAGALTLAAVRASLSVPAAGAAKAYVLAGEVRAEKGRARAGEELTLGSGGSVHVAPVLGWDDWTGGLATTDRAAAPPPFGIGTVGARKPGEQGTPRFPLAIQRLDVRVRIDGDFALTEVDQSFFNPSSETVEGSYGFRTPENAILQRFGVDRDGVVVWGRVKEKTAAAAQYQANVYRGSTEDPALLEWDSPGVYRALLYPIGPGETRRVVVRYAEWLGRTGTGGTRRVYTYPMAAEGSEESLPHVEELKITFDLSRAGARDTRIGMAGVRRGDELVVRAHDFVPRADLSLELLDDGIEGQRAYRARHVVDLEAMAPESRAAATEKAKNEADYLLVPVRESDAKLPRGGLDLVVVIDASAATDAATLSIARAATSALLSHLSDQDRALVLAGDDGLRPIVPGWRQLTKVDSASRLQVQESLSQVVRGGATDLGAMLTTAARELDPTRRAAVVYVGDAAPTVGELTLPLLRERLSKLPAAVRIFGLGVGDGARLDILNGLSHGAFAERITDGYSAARAALRVLEETERPAWLGTKLDLGPNVERVLPSQVTALVSGETQWVLGRIAAGKEPERLKTSGPAGHTDAPLHVVRFDDGGDLARRWAGARLSQMLEAGEGQAALVDLGMKNGIITPFTSFYVPSKSEMSAGERAELETRSARQKRYALGNRGLSPASANRDLAPDAQELSLEQDAAKEGGTGTRARGEEGKKDAYALKKGSLGASVGADSAPPPAASVAAAAPARQRLEESSATTSGTFGGGEVPVEPSAPPPAAKATANDADLSRPGTAWRADFDDAATRGVLSLGAAGGGRAILLPSGGGLANIGATGRSDGASEAKLEGSHARSGVMVKPGMVRVTGRLPSEVIQRITRQNLGLFRRCYDDALRKDPTLEGRVNTRFVIGTDGAVSRLEDAGSDVGDSNMVVCVHQAFNRLGFPSPESGVATVVFSLLFSPAPEAAVGTSAGSLNAPINVNVFIGDLPRKLLGCSAAASAPLEERVALWRERLSKVAGDPRAMATVYRSALGVCEAPSHRERARLLALMLDAMPGVSGKVALYWVMSRDLGAGDLLYRGILARIRTSHEMRELHDALGLETVDPGFLSRLVDATKDPGARARKLRALLEQFPDDLSLSIELLNAYEDAADAGSAREHARRLRERPDADARVRTAVGELYLRLADRAPTAEEKAALAADGRRAFGEIVEFAPEDPVARRRLGDLLLAHGFFIEAARQYETLARLTPDEAQVWLLRARAAEGQGLLEEALKWAEKGGASGAPDGASGPAVTARALAATHLAWARLSAVQSGHAEDLAALSARAARVLSGSRLGPDAPARVRVTLTWSHPEFHPSLWSNALGTPMPAPDGDATLGIAQAFVPERPDAFVEIRLELADLALAARLGASAELTIVFDELGKSEKIVRKRVDFPPGRPASQRFVLTEVRGG